MGNQRWTRENLEATVAISESLADVMRRIGLRVSGGSHSNLKKRLLELNIDTTHFLGRAANRGKAHKGGYQKRTPEELLILGQPGFSTRARLIKRALIEVGVPEICERCGLGPVWRGKVLNLQVDHKNGRRWDN
jgi:hypothetical protein